ncbi:hypothetical protein M409DRAFT_19769 [Zasmidium cellare ATCC 36951]|uniref:Uncharacterized protein n=1 Tax=Zasmidium cellare ATCC 36951 TaxID=1080233 RepID=A0A6A6CTX3_ZASCE|nr:uncharacterized protein M409DRAFT_19769 [Zasmidium cellare ATCC 36951]KAF2170163.1 hypothetical protein M409DRAFT_19769 [Zasmidium cellare ATCC 36951]
MEPDLWQPPPRPTHDQDLRGDPDALTYRRLCDQLFKWWRTDALNSIPPELRKKTQFSLQLLRQVTQLAGLIRNDAARGRDLLKLQWQLRQGNSNAESSTEQWVTTRREYRKKKQDIVEENRENQMGLMIEDVRDAIDQVRDLTKSLCKEAGDQNLATKQDRKDARKRRTREAVSGALRLSRELRDSGENQGLAEADSALVGFGLGTGGSKEKKVRRKAKVAKRIANKREEHMKLPLDRVQFGTLPARSTAEVDSERMTSSMAGLSHAGPDTRAFEFRTNQLEDMDEDEDDESEDDGD